MINFLSKKNRSILTEMVRTDFKIRYQGSALGYLWSVLKPLALFGIMYIIFTVVWPVARGVEHYGVYLLLGVVFWNFFSEATSVGSQSMIVHGSLIRKIDIPRYLIVVASSVSALINLSLSLCVVTVFSILSGVPFTLNWFLVIILAVELYIFSLGVALILATANVRFRDVSYIWEIFLQVGFYASAVLFPLQSVPDNFRNLFFFNPIVQIIQDARMAIVQSDMVVTIWNSNANWFVRYIPFVIISIVLYIGISYFRKKSKYFAENV